jgi:hypothetical protein
MNILNKIKDFFLNSWFLDSEDKKDLRINEVAVRIRAGILLLVPIYMAFTLYDVTYTTSWDVKSWSAEDTYETDMNDRIVYAVEATRRVYEYVLQTQVLFYILFELLAGMTIWGSRISPTIIIANIFARNQEPIYRSIRPKRFAWGMGMFFVIGCIVFFNPEVLAGWVNAFYGSELLSETSNYMPGDTGTVLVMICLVLMWMEAILGFCLGCFIHKLLFKVRIIEEECHECNNLDFTKGISKNEEK